jgi:hypothetical protein
MSRQIATFTLKVCADLTHIERASGSFMSLRYTGGFLCTPVHSASGTQEVSCVLRYTCPSGTQEVSCVLRYTVPRFLWALEP